MKTYFESRICADETAESGKIKAVSENLRGSISRLYEKNKILLDSYLDQDIDRQTFVAKKSEIMSKKKTLEESLARIETNHNVWVEPMRNWLNRAFSICKAVETNDFLAQEVFIAEIFGSNLFLQNKNVVACDEHFQNSPRKIWFSLRETNKKYRATRDKIEKITLMAEERGFEPPLSFPKHDFESCAFNHSATLPWILLYQILQFQ